MSFDERMVFGRFTGDTRMLTAIAPRVAVITEPNPDSGLRVFPNSGENNDASKLEGKPETKQTISEIESAIRAILPEPLPKSVGPGDNAIKQRTMAIFGRQESGKTNTARWIVENAVSQYGQESVNVQVAKAERFRELLQPDCWMTQPVQILVLEDLTFAKIADEDLRDFFRIREIMQGNSQRRDGLCLALFTCHTFFQTPKSLRTNCDGLIALTAPWEEYDRNYLERRIGEDNVRFLENKDGETNGNDGQRSAVMIFRNAQPARIEIPRIRPEKSFMYQMEQYWKQESKETDYNPIVKVIYGLDPNGESASRYGLRLPTRMSTRASDNAPEKSKPQMEDTKPQQPKYESRENRKAITALFLFSSLLLIASYPPQLPALALICLGYAGASLMLGRWVKAIVRRESDSTTRIA